MPYPSRPTLACTVPPMLMLGLGFGRGTIRAGPAGGGVVAPVSGLAEINSNGWTARRADPAAMAAGGDLGELLCCGRGSTPRGQPSNSQNRWT